MSSEPILLPPLLHDHLYLRGHFYLIGPGPGESLSRAFSCGIDPHFAAKTCLRTGMIEDVERAVGYHHVALRVHVVHDLPRHFRIVVDIHVLVADDDELGEHEHARSPDRVDHLFAVARVALSDPDDHIVMEHAFYFHDILR